MNISTPLRVPLLAVLLLSLTGASLAAQTELVLKDGVAEAEGKVTKKDARDKVQNQPCKLYSVSLKQGQCYQIDMTRDKDVIDPYLRLLDAKGKELAKDDNSGEGRNARIYLRAPRDETYTIVATTFGGGEGSFKVKIAELKLAQPGELTLKARKASVISEIADDDLADSVGKQPCRVFTVKLRAGKTYQLDMIKRSAGLNPYLRLEDSAGKELAKDDDGGDGLNARIVFPCFKDGAYRIICTTSQGGTGVFELKVADK